MPKRSDQLAVIVHRNGEVTEIDERGTPVLCKDCRFAGWLTEWSFQNEDPPPHCLHFSGGADTLEGDRVILDNVKKHHGKWEYVHKLRDHAWVGGHMEAMKNWEKRYPLCRNKNRDGNCPDFVRAKPGPKLSWWKRMSKRRREAQRRKMRE